MPAFLGVNREEARREGERLVEQLRSKFRQDVGNARFIGRFSVAGLIAKMRPVVESRLTGSEPPADTTTTPKQPVDGVPPDFAILSASELLDLLLTCTIETAGEILAYEEGHLRRTTVLDAARRRVGE
jgi:hypothetical protein